MTGVKKWAPLMALIALWAALSGMYALGHHHGSEAGWWACMAEHGEVA